MVYKFFDKKSASLVDRSIACSGVTNEIKQNQNCLKNYTN